MAEPEGPSVRHDLPQRVTDVENVFIPMRDGCRIAARIWLPSDAETVPVPAILEYIPYRKRDFMRARDEPIHRYFAAHGYAAVRVDIRGTGDSEGVLSDEYSLQEHEDALEIIDWLVAQPWCSGKVGMMGISWGGFNSLQVAALRPAALRAIMTLCSTDDRYADDAHYMGGCLLNENLQWGAILMTYNALPPDPEIVGERWRSMWLERLEHAVPFPAVWMQHPWRDDYWKHGSVCEDYAAIQCPVYAIGGWADAYSNAIPRLMGGLRCPRKALIGPWAHVFPHDGIPGPAIGFLQEALRWWDYWLKGRDTGIMEEPMMRVWMQESVPPQPQYDERPGRWIAEDVWPSERIRGRTLYLNPGTLAAEPAGRTGQSFTSPQTTGVVAGEWCAFGADGEMPLDQRPDEGRSLTFDSEPLCEPLEILGAPVVELELESDCAVGLIAVRLDDVMPDGTSARVTYGLLNLPHRDSHERPSPMIPGRPYRIRLALNDIAHAFPAGHRLRLALATSYWPLAWPPPDANTLTVYAGVSTLQLPARPRRAADEQLAGFAPPEVAPGPRHKPLRPLPFKRAVEYDLATNELIYTLSSDGGELGGHSLARLEEIGMDLGYTLTKRHRISETDPLSARTALIQRVRLRRDDWSVRIDSEVRLRAAADHLHFFAQLQACENDVPVKTRVWEITIPRRLF
jgi:putative CocE/NonD family hydrolase